jgi:hypothetical protein
MPWGRRQVRHHGKSRWTSLYPSIYNEVRDGFGSVLSPPPGGCVTDNLESLK